jgi:hypothetical protein
MNRLRLRLCRLLCPSSHRLIEVGDVVTDLPMLRGDLIRGGDALARGWNCDPAILWNAAAHLQRERHMGQIMAECDCDTPNACKEMGLCMAVKP